MEQDHTLDISVRQGGEVKVEVHHKGRIPNLLEPFPLDVQVKARRWWVLPTPFERALWLASRGMPYWARETVRQHILHERAQRIRAHMQRVAEMREAKARRRQVRMVAVRKVASAFADRMPKRGKVPALSPVEERTQVTAPTLTSRLPSGSALGSVAPRGLSLTEQLGQTREVPLAVPTGVVRQLGRDR